MKPKKNAKKDAKNSIPENSCKQKTATDNRWISTGLDNYPDNRERRDGPGGEDADN